jgi:hypothetical protein
MLLLYYKPIINTALQFILDSFKLKSIGLNKSSDFHDLVVGLIYFGLELETIDDLLPHLR